VLAVSCKTGEFELVGVFHARYSRAAGLNVVIGIDQVQDLMHTLRRTPRPPSEAVQLDGQARATLADHADHSLEPFFPFGPLAASVRTRADGALVFAVLAREFPMQSAPIAVVEDLPPTPDGDDAFGRPGRVWLGGTQGLKAWRRGQMDAEAQSAVARVTEALRRDALQAFQWRAAARKPSRSREQWDVVQRLEKALRKVAGARGDLVDQLTEVAERLGPQPGDPLVRPAQVMALPVPAGATAAQRD
jgi:serine protease Do